MLKKDLETALEKLQDEFSKDNQTSTQYREAINSVIGISNYDLKFDPVNIANISLPNQKAIMVASVTCHIYFHITDDNTAACITKGAIGYGALDLSASSKADDVANIIQEATSNAFINLCREQLCIGKNSENTGKKEDASKAASKKASNEAGNSENAGKKNVAEITDETKMYDFKSTTLLLELPKAKGSYVIKAKCSYTKKEEVIYFLESTIQSVDPSIMDKWFQNLTKRTGLSFSCYVSIRNNKLYFRDFA